MTATYSLGALDEDVLPSLGQTYIVPIIVAVIVVGVIAFAPHPVG
jgi:hypothetical protein